MQLQVSTQHQMHRQQEREVQTEQRRSQLPNIDAGNHQMSEVRGNTGQKKERAQFEYHRWPHALHEDNLLHH